MKFVEAKPVHAKIWRSAYSRSEKARGGAVYVIYKANQLAMEGKDKVKVCSSIGWNFITDYEGHSSLC